MAREYTKLTVSRETAEWLYEECHRLAEAIRQGQSNVASLTDRAGGQLGCGVSADTLIRIMLDDRQRHRERSRKASKKGRRKRLNNEQSDGKPPLVEIRQCGGGGVLAECGRQVLEEAANAVLREKGEDGGIDLPII